MSPTFFRSSGKTTTVKGQVSWSWQKVRNVGPCVPSATRKTVPLTHWVVPTCLLASAKETQSCLEGLRAEQTPLIVITAARMLPSKHVRVRKRMMAEAQRSAPQFYCRRGGDILRQAGRKFWRRLPEKGTCRRGSAPACHSSRDYKHLARYLLKDFTGADSSSFTSKTV